MESLSPWKVNSEEGIILYKMPHTPDPKTGLDRLYFFSTATVQNIIKVFGYGSNSWCWNPLLYLFLFFLQCFVFINVLVCNFMPQSDTPLRWYSYLTYSLQSLDLFDK